jgi:hypothetical protein
MRITSVSDKAVKKGIEDKPRRTLGVNSLHQKRYASVPLLVPVINNDSCLSQLIVTVSSVCFGESKSGLLQLVNRLT